MFYEVSRESDGGTVTFCSKLGIYNDRSVGTFNYKGRVQPGFYSKICMDRNQENCNSPQRSRYFYGRSKVFNRKKCYGLSVISDRFLQHIISDPQERWKDDTSNKFKAIKCPSEKCPFQDAYHEKSNKSIETQTLGNFTGSERCISTCTNISKASSVHEVLCGKSMPSVESNVLWSNMCSTDFYQTSDSSCSISQNQKHQDCCVSRRLV